MRDVLFTGQEAHLLLQASGQHDHTIDALQNMYVTPPTHPVIMATTKPSLCPALGFCQQCTAETALHACPSPRR